MKIAEEIRKAYQYESIGFIVWGTRGWGKSTYCAHACAEALVPFMDKPDYEATKKVLIFTPKEFCDKVLNTQGKQPLLWWDDAGYWLNRLFWNERFVREALRYMTLARTQFATILFSTPSLKMLPNKLLEQEDVYRVKIKSLEGYADNDCPKWRWRTAHVRKYWVADYDPRKCGSAPAWVDTFSSFMPDDFFEWYEPIREKYLETVKVLIAKAYARIYKKMEKDFQIELENQIDRTIPDEKTLKEVGEVTQNFREE